MTGYTCKLMRRQDVAEGTMAFHLEKPTGFQFKPGQYADLTLAEPPETDAEGNTRTFSIASTPSENELTFATRMRDTAFKRCLRVVPPGTRIALSGPMGSFTLHTSAARPAVLLAGGIGITPFLSMVRQALREGPTWPLSLFYANRRPEDAAFLDVLDSLAKAHAAFRFVPTMTQMEKARRGWTGERGHISADMLRRHLPGLAGPIYYVAGPPGMVAAMREVLVGAGVNEDDIRSEEFGGY